MADITVVTPNLDVNSFSHANMVAGLKTGEDITVGMPVYITSAGTIKKAISSQCTIANVPDFVGLAGTTTVSGCPMTIIGKGGRFNISTGLTPGALFYVSDTAGEISDAKVASADTPFAIAVTSTDIVVIK